MHRYTAYGLSIASDIALPELLEAPGAVKPIVRIRLGKVDRPAESKPVGVSLLWARPGDACLTYDGAGLYHVIGGREIVIDLAPDADERAVRLFLLGPALAILLHQRELLVLHASAVSVNGQVAAFAAEKGEGKSTFAAAMHTRGHPLVTDDLLPVDLRDPRQLLVQPGFPQLKLMPEAAAQLSAQPDELPRLHPDFEKRAQSARQNFPREPLPLSRIFILESAETDSIDVIPPQQRFVELVRHSYLAQILGVTGEAAVHFRQVVTLAQRVPVLRLRRRRQIAALPDAARMVEVEINHA
jgi:hypothetical protein